MSDLRVLTLDTPVGAARVSVSDATGDDGSPARWLVLGHGAGGWSWSKDVVAVRDGAVAAGWTVALVDQPWRVAGRRVADRPPVLDRAWLPILAALRESADPATVVVGGRSAGARVACRTASEVGADAVLCLSFPLHPPGQPDRSRADELQQPLDAGLPVLVLQGAKDPYGVPEEVRSAGPGAEVVEVPGSHTLTSPARVGELVTGWLEHLR